jgi:non-lysosomal glucosylceramidase
MQILNMQDTSLPCAVFVWTVENHGSEMIDVSITCTFKNGQGDSRGDDVAGGVWNRVFHSSGQDCPLVPATADKISGVQIHQTLGGMQCTYAVAARQSVISLLSMLCI